VFAVVKTCEGLLERRPCTGLLIRMTRRIRGSRAARTNARILQWRREECDGAKNVSCCKNPGTVEEKLAAAAKPSPIKFEMNWIFRVQGLANPAGREFTPPKTWMRKAISLSFSGESCARLQVATRVISTGRHHGLIWIIHELPIGDRQGTVLTVPKNDVLSLFFYLASRTVRYN